MQILLLICISAHLTLCLMELNPVKNKIERELAVLILTPLPILWIVSLGYTYLFL